ncbi:MAG: hypothetical protein Tp138OMZ00d2C19078221_6 [Prokaryotic dsDNA virus sp.]|nr:MAG: hypothetical protein Tp138OMZ00d2C19078221_6 [Prokaryotic dsDNA virus sp.]
MELAGKEAEGNKNEIELIRKSLSYCPETGIFKWKSVNKNHNEKHGKVAGTKKGRYVSITLAGKRHRAHRLAWLITFGYWPILVDHINGDGRDNRIENLRNTTSSVNAQNHTRVKSKKKDLPVGVKLLASGNYQARATAGGKCYALGSYKTKQEAHDVYVRFTERFHNNPAVC